MRNGNQEQRKYKKTQENLKGRLLHHKWLESMHTLLASRLLDFLFGLMARCFVSRVVLLKIALSFAAVPTFFSFLFSFFFFFFYSFPAPGI